MIYLRSKVAQSLVIVAFLSLVGGPVTAADEPANVAKYRVELMKTQAGHLRAIVAVLKGEISHAAHVKAHADAIKAISEMVGEVFPEGSAVAESRAKPEIWQNWDKFLEVYGAYKDATAKLAEVAATGDLAAVGAQLQAVGETCGGCHKPFRKEKK